MSENTNNTNGPVRLTVSGILGDLDNGLNRKDIKEKYGLSVSDMTKLFQHPQLKNKKPRKAPGFILEDDVTVVAEGENTVQDASPEATHEEEGSPVQETATVTDSVFE